MAGQLRRYRHVRAPEVHKSQNIGTISATCCPWTQSHHLNEAVYLTPMATVKVGKEHEEIWVHSGVLSQHSGFFKAALRGPFSEAQTKTIILDDVDLDIFTSIVQWMYSGELNEHRFWCDHFDHASELVRLWVLADRFLMPTLKNLIINAMHQAMIQSFPVPLLNAFKASQLWNEVPKDSEMSRYLVDVLVWIQASDNDVFNETMHLFPKPLLVELMNVIGRKGLLRYSNIEPSRSSWAGWNLCQFHDHLQEKAIGNQSSNVWNSPP